jgi:hypothetical protein
MLPACSSFECSYLVSESQPHTYSSTIFRVMERSEDFHRYQDNVSTMPPSGLWLPGGHHYPNVFSSSPGIESCLHP